ncbi:MAG TPA: AAA family ATPase [Blastocatellia bacterium]|nr:AAA family ATPase [Blastocatellia bacterium]
MQHIAAVYNIHPPDEGGVRITPSLKDSLSRLLDSHTLFGGRDAELQRLNTFLKQRASGYLFVTALSGYGKTALLANWVRTFPRDNLQVCYHFISRLYGKTAEEDFALRNLCQQLTAYHDLRGGLPTNTSDLRALYPYLLAIPTTHEQKLVVVLDGLDEAQDWIGPELFPPSLPEGVFVVFSAREIAERDWLASLELPRSELEVLELTTLGLAEIAHLLRAAGGETRRWAEDDGFVATMYEKSAGDPFYLRYLVEDIRDGRINSLAQLANQPSKLKGYLDRWWQEVSQAVSETAVNDLLGYLLVAKGRLSRDDLTDISQTDALNGAVFERTIKQVQRYVIGDEKEGYTFCHPRFRDYVAQERIKEIEQQPYRQRLLDYCARWREHKREYALAHYVPHLAEVGRAEDLPDLLGPEWLCAKWNCFGSYSALIQDLNVAATVALKQEPPKFADVAALAVARQTARELMLGFPTAILTGWVRLGEIKRVLELLKALGAVKGRAAESLTVVAAELLGLKKTGEISTDRVDLAQVAADLLGQAVGMLHQVRSSSSQLEALAAITALLSINGSLRNSRHASLLEQVQDFAQSIREPALQTSALGLVAEALAASESGQEQARRLVDQSRSVMNKIDYAPDRMAAIAYLLPALKSVDPSSVLSSIYSTYKSADPFASSSLDKFPLRTLLEKWAPKGDLDKKEATLILQEIGELCLNRQEPDGFITGYVVAALCELGQGKMAVDIIRNLWKRSALEGARAVMQSTGSLYLAEPDATNAWLEQAKEFTDYSHHDFFINRELFTKGLVSSFALIGKWDSAIGLLETIRPRERVEGLCKCLTLASAAFATDSAEMRSTMDKLIELSQDAEADDQAQVYAVAAQELVPHDLMAARKHLNHAVGLCLANLPEGDTDDLRKLLAIALHEAGDYMGASAAIRPMKWGQSAIETYSKLIEITPAVLASTLTEYAEGILEILDFKAEPLLFDEALLNSLSAARHLSEKQLEMARRLCDYAFEAAPNLGDSDKIIKCLATEAAIRSLFDPPTGLAHFDTIIETVHEFLRTGGEVSIYAIVDIYKQLGTIALKVPTETLVRLERAASWADFFPSLEDRVKLESAYAVALTPIDISRTMTLLRKQLPAIAELGQVSPPAFHLSRMISEFVGRRIGPRHLQTETAQTIGAAIVAVASHSPQEAGELMGILLAAIRAIESPRDLAQALVDFFDHCSKGPVNLLPHLAVLYTTALDQARNLPESELVTYVLSETAEAFCRAGSIEDARHTAQLLDDTEAKTRAETAIQIATERMELGTLSPLEQVFVDVRDSTPYAVVHSTKVEGTAKEVLVELAEELVNDRISWERHSLISDWIWLMIVPAKEVDGVGAIASFINAIEGFDRHFLNAASLIAEQ